MKRLNKKLKQIEKLEALTRDLNDDEKSKVTAKAELLLKMEQLSLTDQ
jgi:hypothetical protein